METRVSRMTTDSRATTRAARIPELDLLRFAAAIAVVLYHFTYRPVVGGQINETIAGGLQAVTRFGYLGVPLFFLLSGFVILWSSEHRSPGEFVASRIARLYPSFWTCALLTALVLAWAGHPASGPALAANLTMAPSLFGISYLDGVYWTLFVEAKFYVVIFVILLSGTMPAIERWLMGWLAVCIVCATGRAPHVLGSLALAPFGPYFISGALCFLMRSRGVSGLRVAALCVSCALAVATALSRQPDFITGHAYGVGGTSTIVVAVAIVVFHVALVVIALRPPMLRHARAWYLLGSLTYPLYLAHNQIGKVLAAPLEETASFGVSLALRLAIVIGVATIIAFFTERRACGAVQRALFRARRRVLAYRTDPAHSAAGGVQ